MSDDLCIDPSGWRTFTHDDGSIRVEAVLTRRAQLAMSSRQITDFGQACKLMSRAFAPEEPGDDPTTGCH